MAAAVVPPGHRVGEPLVEVALRRTGEKGVGRAGDRVDKAAAERELDWVRPRKNRPPAFT